MNRNFIESLFPDIVDSGHITYKAKGNNTQFVNLDVLIEKILTRHGLYVAELQAKVYAYEKIIANSNFKSILETKVNGVDKE